MTSDGFSLIVSFWPDAASLAMANAAAVAVLCYALGCFSTGYYLVRWRTGQDIRSLGSGATGGRNVGRLLGSSGFIITMSVDLVKGALAVWLVRPVGLPAWLVALPVVAVVMGHIWPLQLGFRGGKGLSTVLGAMLVFDPTIAILLLVLSALIGFVLRSYHMGVLITVALAPLISGILGYTWTVAVTLALTAVVILIAHRDNIAMPMGNRTNHPR